METKVEIKDGNIILTCGGCGGTHILKRDGENLKVDSELPETEESKLKKLSRATLENFFPVVK